MRGQKLGTLEYPKVFEALVDLQTPFVINPAMTSDTTPSGVIVYSSRDSAQHHEAHTTFNRLSFS